MSCVVGLDAGSTHGAAVATFGGEITSGVKPSHSLHTSSLFAGYTESQIVERLVTFLAIMQPVEVHIEKVGMRPGQGRSSNAKLVRNHSAIRAVCVARGLPIVEVSPLQWRHFYALPAEDSYAKRKKANWRFAQTFIPELTEDEADAYLIARRGLQLLTTRDV